MSSAADHRNDGKPVRGREPALFDVSSSAKRRVSVWVDAMFVAVLCVATAILSFGAWRDLRAPLQYAGDATYDQFVIKSILDHGWLAHNDALGAPFGATMYDFPFPEPTHLALIRLLGLFTHDPFLCFNLFYLISFATTGVAAWFALRMLGATRVMAIAGAFLFCILPYHFYRLGHLFLASYFAVPIFAAYALRLALDGTTTQTRRALTGATALLLVVAAGGGIYYAFFGCFFIAAGAVLGASASRRREPLRDGALAIAIVVAVVALSLVPNAWFQWHEGANIEVAQRTAGESDMYGLRITQLLLPATGHRIAAWGAMTDRYNALAPLINENKTAALGLLASVGLLVAMLALFTGSRVRVPAVAAAGTLAIVGILFATIGGFGTLFALLVTPEMRGLNRISVFIGFFAIVSLILLTQRLFGTRPVALATCAVLFIAIGWIDEIPTRAIARSNASAFNQRQVFFDRLEAALPPGTAVYELPYIWFPEGPLKTGALGSYDLLEPFLRTHGLRWSFGDARGRASDQWNEQVSNLDGAELAGTLARAGFGAIYVDRRGYADHGAAIERSLAAVLGAPAIESTEHDIAVYRLPASLGATARPFPVVGHGRGWYPWAADASGDPAGWSKGSADLLVGNPNGALPITVEFELSAATAREVRIRYGEQNLGAYALQPGVPKKVALQLHAAEGVSRISLETDFPATRDASGRSIAFRIADLAYGPTR